MSQPAGPLEIILQDIERALQARLWYVALAVALSLPDICSLLEQPPDEAWSKRKKYADWFDKNVGAKFFSLTGDDCYSLRGGVVHHGRFGHKKARFDRIAFTIPGSGPRIGEILAEQGPMGDVALTMDLSMFCEKIIVSVREWFEANHGNANVRANPPNVVRLRPHGLFGVVHGVPVISSGPDPLDDLAPFLHRT